MWTRVLEVCSGNHEPYEMVKVDHGPDQQTPEQNTRKEQHYRPLTGLRFLVKDGLIYYWDRVDGGELLCIPEALALELFRQAHDEFSHQGVNRTYNRIRQSFFVRGLSKLLKRYIEHCPACQLNQTSRNQPHGDLQPIDHDARPFEVVCIDLITHLPETRDNKNALMTRTCHASKMARSGRLVLRAMVSGNDKRQLQDRMGSPTRHYLGPGRQVHHGPDEQAASRAGNKVFHNCRVPPRSRRAIRAHKSDSRNRVEISCHRKPQR